MGSIVNKREEAMSVERLVGEDGKTDSARAQSFKCSTPLNGNRQGKKADKPTRLKLNCTDFLTDEILSNS